MHLKVGVYFGKFVKSLSAFSAEWALVSLKCDLINNQISQIFYYPFSTFLLIWLIALKKIKNILILPKANRFGLSQIIIEYFEVPLMQPLFIEKLARLLIQVLNVCNGLTAYEGDYFRFKFWDHLKIRQSSDQYLFPLPLKSKDLMYQNRKLTIDLS